MQTTTKILRQITEQGSMTRIGVISVAGNLTRINVLTHDVGLTTVVHTVVGGTMDSTIVGKG